MNKPSYKQAENAIFLTMPQAMERYQLGRGTVEKMAHECKAAVKIGRAKRYNAGKLDSYLSSLEA